MSTQQTLPAKKPEQTTAIASMPLRQLLQQDDIKMQIAKALPSHMTPDRMLRVASTALLRTPKLAQCTQASFIKCLLDLSALGLEPDGRRAHLIPFDVKKKVGSDWVVERTDCTLVVDYKGYVELVRRSALVSSIHADVVCENDEFKHNLGVIESHTFDLRKPRGEWYAAYAMVHLRDGGNQSVILSRQEIESIRDKSQGWTAFKKGWAKSSVWQDYPQEMAKKTAFRRLTKWLTLSPEIVDALDREDASEHTIETTAVRIEHESGTDRVMAMLSDGGPTPEDVAGTVEHEQGEFK